MLAKGVFELLGVFAVTRLFGEAEPRLRCVLTRRNPLLQGGPEAGCEIPADLGHLDLGFARKPYGGDHLRRLGEILDCEAAKLAVMGYNAGPRVVLRRGMDDQALPR